MRYIYRKAAKFLILLLCIIIAILIFFAYRKRIETRARKLYIYASNLYLSHYLSIEKELDKNFPDENSQKEKYLEYKLLWEKKEKIYNEASQVFLEIHGRFPSTIYGERSLYNIAYMNFQRRNYKACMKMLKRYIEMYKESSIFFIASIKNLACLYVITGDNARAYDFIDGFISRDNFIQDFPAEILLFQSGLLLFGKDSGSASEIFRFIYNEYSGNNIAEIASKYITIERNIINNADNEADIQDIIPTKSVFEDMVFDEVKCIEDFLRPI